jgi:hypothetical protein
MPCHAARNCSRGKLKAIIFITTDGPDLPQLVFLGQVTSNAADCRPPPPMTLQDCRYADYDMGTGPFRPRTFPGEFLSAWVSRNRKTGACDDGRGSSQLADDQLPG